MKAGSSTLEPPQAATDERVPDADLLAALPRRSATREVKVGAFVLIGLIAFFIALFTLTDVGTFRGRYYTTTVIEHAGGMRNGDPVQMRGVNIGRVTDFEMVPSGVAVTLEVYNRYHVPDDSRVAVRSAGLLGGMTVDVTPGLSSERASREEPLPGTVDADIMTAAVGLSSQAEDVFTRASLLLSEENIGALGASAGEAQALLGELRDLAATQREEISLLVQSLRRSAEGVERATSGPELESVIANMDAVTARLDESAGSLAEASSTLNVVLGRIERGEGTLGRLSADETLYDNLNGAVVSLQQLVNDIREEPRRYLNLRVF